MPRKSEYQLDKATEQAKNARKKTKKQRLLERELTDQGTNRGTNRRNVARSKPPSTPPPPNPIPWYKRRGNGNFFMGMTWKEWFIFTAVVSLGCASWMPLLIKLLKTCRMNLFVSKSKDLNSLCLSMFCLV